MRSNRDMRSDSEREIDDFLSQFETPEDELTADINSYLNDDVGSAGKAPSNTFQWKEYDTTEFNYSPSVKKDETIAVPSVKDEAEVRPVKKEAARVKHSRKHDAALRPVSKDEPAAAPVAPTDASMDEASSPAPLAAAATVSAAVSAAEDAHAGAEHAAHAAHARSGEADASSSSGKRSSKKKSGKSGKSSGKSGRSGGKAKKSLGARLFLKPNPSYDPALGASSKNKPMKVSAKKIILDIVAVGLIFVLAGVIYAASCIMSAPKYDYSDIYAEVDTSSMIYDDAGKQIDSVYYTQNRKVVKYKNIPEDLVDAFVALEDKTFWKHHGFNWTRMVGAVLSSITGNGRISGTSTITQQLARNVYLADIKSQRSISRKIKEMYYANRIEHFLSKEQIVEAYLNSVYFGYGCYGVDAAAKTYFSKKAKDLTLVECAALAALPQSPDTYALLKYADDNADVSEDSKIVQKEPDIIVTNDLSKDRRDLALWLMKDQGYITEDEYDSAVDKSINSFIKPTITSGYGDYTYYHEYLVDTVVNDLMKEYDMEYNDAERMVYTRGLQIYSTMDSKAQKVVAREFQDASNFPMISAIYNTDADGNMLNNDGDIALYNYDHFFDADGNFALSSDDVKVGSDGSLTILKGHKLNIYETEVNGELDYSLEFKNYYKLEEDRLYSIQGGYVNVPSTYKSADSDGNLVISADFFSDPQYEGCIVVSGDSAAITSKGYSLSKRIRQPQGAMVIIGVGTGEVKAMVGGRTFEGQKLLNRALNSRQPGSSIKPLAVYGAALQRSYELQQDGKKWEYTDFDIDKQGTKGWGDYVTVHSSIEDERTHIENKDWPDNVTKSFSGKNTFRTAIQKSINTCAVKLQLQLGAAYSMNQLQKFGITTAVDDESQATNDMNPAALALGAMCQGVKPIEMAAAYASFPGGGVLHSPICYTKVLDRNGEVLLEGKSEETEALNEGVAWIMTDVLKSVVTANGYIHLDGVQPGGKTGTTNERYDIWFDGFTPTYAAALWIGTDNNVEMGSGSTAAANLWGKIMNQIPNALTGEYAAQPSNVINYYGEYYTQGTETGLTSWSNADEIKKRKAAAKKKWMAEREKHKKWVVDEEGHYETIHHDAVYEDQEYTETETYQEQVGTEHHDEVLDDEGNVVSEAYDEPIYETKTREIKKTRRVKVKDAYDEKGKWIKEKGHWEYEKGYRDGDFKYNGN